MLQFKLMLNYFLFWTWIENTIDSLPSLLPLFLSVSKNQAYHKSRLPGVTLLIKKKGKWRPASARRFLYSAKCLHSVSTV